ncbi:MAG: hypothetical protein JSV63_01700 [Candidatus Aenigmatarchaeota archaeon]|nr:MAG: hypothetical protein JSV63_01700 [Candidatus Aenigmarchaeota archaeon]
MTMDKRLLRKAFMAQQKDHRRRLSFLGDRVHVDFYNSKPFNYDAELPEGIRLLGREKGGRLGPAVPYLVFERPIDTDTMLHALCDEFDSEIDIRLPYFPEDTTYRVKNKRNHPLRNTLCDLIGNRLYFLTDDGSYADRRDTVRLIRAITNYLDTINTVKDVQ